MSHPHPKAVPPFRIEQFKSGYCAILDSSGINWTTGRGGATLFYSEQDARDWAAEQGFEISERAA